jgi:hypothetical protein
MQTQRCAELPCWSLLAIGANKSLHLNYWFMTGFWYSAGGSNTDSGIEPFSTETAVSPMALRRGCYAKQSCNELLHEPLCVTAALALTSFDNQMGVRTSKPGSHLFQRTQQFH